MKLTLENFRCYEKKELDFGDNGLTLINGSSGVGKSTLMMAIEFALFGSGTKIVSNSKKSCSVQLEIDGLKIFRKKGPNHLIVNEIYEDDAGETLIQERFGKIFNSVSYIPQNMKKSFVLMSPSERLDFLENFAFTGIDICQIKSRTKSLIKQTYDAHTKTVGNLEFASKLLTERVKPKEISFPIKCSKANRERHVKNTEVKHKNSIIIIKKTEKEIRLLEEEMNNITLLNAVLSEKQTNLDSICSKIEDINEKLKNISYIGDDSLSSLKTDLNHIISKKDIINTQTKYEQDKKRLEELKDKELSEYKSKIQELKQNLWTSITKEEIDEQIMCWKDLLKKRDELKRLKKEINILNIPEDPTLELSKISEKVSNTQEVIKKLNLQKQVMSCPHCHNKVILSDGNNLIPYEEQTNISGEITQLTKELQKLKIDESKKQSELSSYKIKTERYKTLKASIDVLEKDMEEGDIDEEIESLECYKSENISSEKQIQELENNIKHNKFSSTIQSLQKNNIEDKRKIDNFGGDIKVLYSIPEEELRITITEQTQVKDKLSALNFQLQELEREKIKTQRNIDELNQNHIQKYGNIKSTEDNSKNIDELNKIILENKNKQEETFHILEQIKLYQVYEKELEDWNKLKQNVLHLEQTELNDRKKYASACMFKDKILEAESISIQNMIDNINTHVHLYLENFFPDNPINVRISAFKETKKEEAKPSVNLEIDYKGIEHDLSMLSGGELSRVILAFTLALAEIHNSPIILLDECTSSLDQELTNSVITGLKENFGNKLVILIAHQVVQGMFDKIIQL